MSGNCGQLIETPRICCHPLQDWLPEKHLARFVVDIVDRLDLGEWNSVTGEAGSRPTIRYCPWAYCSMGMPGGVLQPQAGAVTI